MNMGFIIIIATTLGSDVIVMSMCVSRKLHDTTWVHMKRLSKLKTTVIVPLYTYITYIVKQILTYLRVYVGTIHSD